MTYAILILRTMTRRKVWHGWLAAWILFSGVAAWSQPQPPAARLDIHAGPSSAPHSRPELIIGSWNIRWFPGGHPSRATPQSEQQQIRGVRRVLDRHSPDILFLCEIRDLDSLRRLGLDHSHIVCTDIPRLPSENDSLPKQSLALLSRVPWQEVWAADFSRLPDSPDRPSRGFLAARFAMPDNTPIVIYGVHLKSNRGGAETNFRRREHAIEQIISDWRQRGLDPARDRIIIFGDFNTSPHDPVFAGERTLRMLEELGFDNAAAGLDPNARTTIPGDERFPPNDFDHILLSPALAAHMGRAPPWVRIIAVPPDLSDHHALFLSLPSAAE